MRFLIALLLAAAMGITVGNDALIPQTEIDVWTRDCVTLESGRVNKVEAGQLLCVVLPENQTTPYRWEYTVSDAALLSLEHDEYTTDPNPQKMVGVGGKHAYYFRAAGAGACTLRFGSVRVGEGMESAFEREAYEIEIADPSGHAAAKTNGMFPVGIEEWMASVEAALRDAGLHTGEPFAFHEISEYYRYYELRLADGLVVVRLSVKADMSPNAISVEMDYYEKDLTPQEREEGIALMKAALVACIAATDPTVEAARADELAHTLGEWVEEALTRGVNMGHDEQEGAYYYSVMNDIYQRSADFSIHTYPIYQGSIFDGMDTDALMYEEQDAEDQQAF